MLCFEEIMKAVIIIIAIFGLALFWPVYDLDISHDVEWKNHRIVERNFLTLGSCRDAVGKYAVVDWVCLKKTGWGQLTNDYSKYYSNTNKHNEEVKRTTFPLTLQSARLPLRYAL